VRIHVLLEMVDSEDWAPTDPQLGACNNVKIALDEQLTSWEQVKEEDDTSVLTRGAQSVRPATAKCRSAP
jgi:hypothetical protein